MQWSSVSDRKRGGEFLLKEGVVVERGEGGVFRFEVFREGYEEEGGRRRDGEVGGFEE